jgi:hypothetical protein
MRHGRAAVWPVTGDAGLDRKRSVYTESRKVQALFLGWLFIVVPTITGPGAAWVTLATCENAVSPRASHKIPMNFPVSEGHESLGA